MDFATLEAQIDAVRRFERWYDAYLRRSLSAVTCRDPFNASDTRILHELFFMPDGASGACLAGRLSLDAGTVCRALKKLAAWDLIRPQASASDRRMKEWQLTEEGRRFAATIENQYRDRWRVPLRILDSAIDGDIVPAMRQIEMALSIPIVRDLLTRS